MADECTCRYTEKREVRGDVFLACRYPWKFNHAALLWNTMCFSRDGIPTAQRYTPRICMFNAASVVSLCSASWHYKYKDSAHDTCTDRKALILIWNYIWYSHISTALKLEHHNTFLYGYSIFYWGAKLKAGLVECTCTVGKVNNYICLASVERSSKLF